MLQRPSAQTLGSAAGVFQHHVVVCKYGGGFAAIAIHFGNHHAPSRDIGGKHCQGSIRTGKDAAIISDQAVVEITRICRR